MLVIDNASCHSRQAETILHEDEFIGNVLLRLAPHSLMLNAIEEVVDEILLEYVHFVFVNKYSVFGFV